MIAAFQISSAYSLTRRRLRVPAWPQSLFVATEAYDRHLHLTLGMRQFTNFNFLRLNVPWTGRAKVLIDHLHLDRVVTFDRARMLATSGVIGQQALLHAGRAIVGVAFVLVRVMAFRCDFAR